MPNASAAHATVTGRTREDASAAREAAGAETEVEVDFGMRRRDQNLPAVPPQARGMTPTVLIEEQRDDDMMVYEEALLDPEDADDEDEASGSVDADHSMNVDGGAPGGPRVKRKR